MSEPSIDITNGGPYAARRVKLVRMQPSNDADGYPESWDFYETLSAEPVVNVWLCRCGRSKNKPYCDGSHRDADVDLTETAPRDGYLERAREYPAGHLTMRDDESLCTQAAYCANSTTDVWQLADQSDDPQAQTLLKSMVQHCTSGRLTVREAGASEDDEPELPVQVGVADNGPYLVTGAVQVRGADGQAYERRNRVSLCRCGESANKPFCDGGHVDAGFTDPPE